MASGLGVRRNEEHESQRQATHIYADNVAVVTGIDTKRALELARMAMGDNAIKLYGLK